MVAPNGVDCFEFLYLSSDNVLKDDKKCRERYLNHLDPTVNHGPWTDAEDCMLFLKQVHVCSVQQHYVPAK